MPRRLLLRALQLQGGAGGAVCMSPNFVLVLSFFVLVQAGEEVDEDVMAAAHAVHAPPTLCCLFLFCAFRRARRWTRM